MNKTERLLPVFMIILGITSTACRKDVEGLYIAPELEPYVAEFVAEAASYGVNVQLQDMEINWVSFEGQPYLGMCTVFGAGDENDSGRRVGINVDLLEQYKEELASGEMVDAIRIVVAHELGHCARELNLGHRNLLSHNGLHQESAMHYRALNQTSWKLEKQNYYMELFVGTEDVDW